ncbi:leucine-rich repeat and calponin homology domain-containing protein 2-like [Agelaius tricolor]|uniref:leucine-rich repeat and calponin homology domain-containing protein 2-like n=1 Tax=Agelaius tricolor TaxID=9191 RepID=UPI0039F1C334
MAAGQGGGGGNNGSGSGSGTAAGSGAAGLGIPAHLTLSFSSGPHWGAAALPQSHTVRSLERALEEAGSSGILCLSGRKLRDFPGSGCDLSDTTQAGNTVSLGEPAKKHTEVVPVGQGYLLMKLSGW